MGTLAVLVLSFVAVCWAIPRPELPPYEPPETHDEFDLGPGKWRFGLTPLVEGRKNCWYYLRFRVKSSDNVYIQFSPENKDGSEKSYEIVIGEKEVTFQRGREGDPIVSKSKNKIINGKWQEFYIRKTERFWVIGDEDDKIFASFTDDNAYDVKYVGVKSDKKSWWKFERLGFGRPVITRDIHNPGRFTWDFPEILRESFYFEFGVKAERDAKLVFSPTEGYGQDIYEIIILAEGKYLCLRRKKGESPIRDIPAANILHKRQHRYFWVRYDYGEGRLTFGRYGEEEPLIDFTDDNPLRIKHFGVTSEKVKSWWRFYLPCPVDGPLYICEHDSYELTCPQGERISINNVLYGRENKAFCYRKGAMKTAECGDADKSYEVLRRECSGKQNCEIRAKNDVFGDPCRGTFKYLQLDYSCCKCD